MSIISTINQAVVSSSFSSASSLSSASSQESLLKTAFAQDTSGIKYTEDTSADSLSSIVNTALNDNEGLNLLNSLSRVGSYSATNSILETAYDTSSAIDEFI